MVEAQKVQQAVHQQQIQLLPERDSMLESLARGGFHADHDVPELPGRRARAQLSPLPQLRPAGEWERKHIGGPIFSAPLLVQGADPAVMGEEEGNLSFF